MYTVFIEKYTVFSLPTVHYGYSFVLLVTYTFEFGDHILSQAKDHGIAFSPKTLLFSLKFSVCEPYTFIYLTTTLKTLQVNNWPRQTLHLDQSEVILLVKRPLTKYLTIQNIE